MNQKINFINSVKKISCDGGVGNSKHPLIYLNTRNENFAVCPYCSKYFSSKDLNNSLNLLNSLNFLNKNNKN